MFHVFLIEDIVLRVMLQKGVENSVGSAHPLLILDSNFKAISVFHSKMKIETAARSILMGVCMQIVTVAFNSPIIESSQRHLI